MCKRHELCFQNGKEAINYSSKLTNFVNYSTSSESVTFLKGKCGWLKDLILIHFSCLRTALHSVKIFFVLFNYSASKVLTFIKGQCLIWTFKELHIPQLHDMIDISHLNI